jgi:hypothetical protein
MLVNIYGFTDFRGNWKRITNPFRASTKVKTGIDPDAIPHWLDSFFEGMV